MKKIAILTSVHPFNDMRIFYKQAISLKKAGYAVIEIAQCEKSINLGGIQIIALNKPSNRIYRLLVTSFRLLQIALREKCDVYHFHDPELIPIGIILKLLGKKVIFDVHEDLHETIAYKKWIPKPGRVVLKGFVFASEYVSGLFFDAIITATEKIATRFPSSKTTVVYNYPIIDELRVEDSLSIQERSKICVYVGGISIERGFIQMVDSIAQLPDVVLNVLGEVHVSSYQEYISEKKLEDRVFLVGRQDRNEVARYLNGSVCGLVLLHPTQNHYWSYPIKMFEYMSVGLPVIASDFPQWREIIEGSDCGLLVDPLNLTEIVDAIKLLVDDTAFAQRLGDNGKKAIYSKYNWKLEEFKLLKAYEKVLQDA